MSEKTGANHRNVALAAILGGVTTIVVAGITPGLRRADAAETVVTGATTRMISLDANGRAIVIDQSNMAYLVDAASGRAALILNDKNEPLRVR